MRGSRSAIIAAMDLFTSDHLDFPRPAGHRFPLEKYRLLREGLLREEIAAPSEIAPAPSATRGELELAHDAAWVEAVLEGEEVRNVGHVDGLLDADDLEGRVQNRVDHELHVRLRQTLDFVQVENVEQETHLVLELRVAEDDQPRKEFQGVDQPVLVDVPNDEGVAPRREDLLELGEVDAEVLADGFVGAEVLLEFGDGLVQQGAVAVVLGAVFQDSDVVANFVDRKRVV